MTFTPFYFLNGYRPIIANIACLYAAIWIPFYLLKVISLPAIFDKAQYFYGISLLLFFPWNPTITSMDKMAWFGFEPIIGFLEITLVSVLLFIFFPKLRIINILIAFVCCMIINAGVLYFINPSFAL